MKINLPYGLLPLFISKKRKGIQKNQDKEFSKNNTSIEDYLNTENVLLSKNNIDLKEISVIVEEVITEKSSRPFNDKKNIKILIVEDNKANQIQISGLLSKEKYQFDIVKNGWEAICAFEACRYDLILMDIHMPVINGEEATKAIRKTNKEIPIIALTADEICDELFEDKLFMGFNDVISKPFKNDSFITTIRNIITLTKRSFPESSGFDGVTWAS